MMTPKDNSTNSSLRNICILPVVFAVFFMMGLWLFFPGQGVQFRLEQELSQQLQRPVQVGEVDLELPLTLAVDTIETEALPRFSIEFNQLKVRPLWLSLFTGQPAVSLQGETFGGNFSAELDSARHLQLLANDLHWNQPLPQLPSIHLNTTIETLRSSGFLNPINQLEQLKLLLADLTISGIKQFGAPIDQLNLGRIELQASQNERQLSIDNFTSTGGDLKLNGHGTIMLQRNIMRSRLDLTLNISPASHLDPTLSALLPLVAKPQGNGSFQLRIAGTVEMPRIR